MSRFEAGYRTTSAATNLLPQASIYAAATGRIHVVELGVFNTTSTAVNIALARLTTAGTSTAVVGQYEDDDTATALATPRNTHSSTGPTIATVALRYTDLGAAVGSGVVWTFGSGRGTGLLIPAGVTNGVGIYTPNGTGQVVDVYWVWDE